MPFLGAHMSVAGGLSRAVERAVVHRCRALQIFAKNANQWRGRPLDVSEIAEFRASVERAALVSVVSHASYLINLAATTEAVREQSRIAMADEIDRAEALGLLGVVLHPGAHLSAGREEALRLVAVELLSLFDQRRAGKTMVLLEGTAGQGTCLGARFEELAAIIDAAGGHPRLGVCLDTCHLLAAGYDIASVDGYRRTFDEFGQIVGFDRLRVVHLNDSKRALGSRVDRHEHIGKGYLGLESFRRLLNDERFASMPMILETPKGQGKATGPIAIDPLDERNLNTLRSLLPAPMGPTPRPPGCASI
jgi:deoxyribonuclease-4